MELEKSQIPVHKWSGQYKIIMHLVMSIFNKIPKIESNKLASIKAYLILIGLVLAAYFLFDAAGNNFYSTAKSKTDILKNIYDLKKETGSDSNVNLYLNALAVKVIQKRSFYENAIDYVSYIFVPGHKSPMGDNRSGFLQLISSSWLWMICIIYAPFSNNLKKNIVGESLLNTKVIITMCAISVLNCYIFNLIPIIVWPTVNYIINGFLQYAELKIYVHFATVKYVPIKKEDSL